MEELRAAKGGGGRRRAAWAVLALCFAAHSLAAQDTSSVRFTHDSISVRFVETDIRAVIQAIGQYLPKPVLVGPIQAVRVTLQTPGAVDRATLLSLLKGLVQSQNLEFTEDSAYYRIGVKQTADRPAARQQRFRSDAALRHPTASRAGFGCGRDCEPIVRWDRRVFRAVRIVDRDAFG